MGKTFTNVVNFFYQKSDFEKTSLGTAVKILVLNIFPLGWNYVEP